MISPFLSIQSLVFFAEGKCLLQVERRGHILRCCQQKGCCFFLPGKNPALNTRYLGYISLWTRWISSHISHFPGTYRKHAVVSCSCWECSPWLLLKFCHFLERKTGFLVPEKEHKSQSWDTVSGLFLNIIQNVFFIKGRNSPWSKNRNTFLPSSWLVLNSTLICRIKWASFSRYKLLRKDIKRNVDLDTTFELSVRVPSVKNSPEKHREARLKGNRRLRKEESGKVW